MNFLKFSLVLSVVALFLVLPQVNLSGYVQGTISSKFIYFLYGCLILLGLYILNIVSEKKIIFSFSKLDFALVALIGYVSFNRYVIQSYFGFSIRYAELIGLSFLYIILRSLSSRNYYWLLLVIIVSGIFQAVYGNLQLLGYYPSNHSGFKMTGSFFNPGPYAGFLVSVWSVAIGMFLFKDKITSLVQSEVKNTFLFLNVFIKYAFEYIPLLGLVSIALVLPATQSRASWLAAVISGLILFEFRYSFLSNLFKRISVFKKALVSILSIGILYVGLFGIYNFKKGSSDGRVFIWKVTTEMIVENPFFGVGFDNFKAHYMNQQAHYFAINGETPEAMIADNTYYAFNEWLQFMAENGSLGFMLLVGVLLILFKIKVKEEIKYAALIAKISLLTISVFACFSYPMQILPVKLILVFLVALLANSDTDSYLFYCKANNMRQWAFKTVVLVLGVFYLYQTNCYVRNLNQGFITWGNALNDHQYGDYAGSINEYESVYTIFKNDGDFLMNYGKTLALAGKHRKAIEILEQAKNFLNTTVLETALGDNYKALRQYGKAEICYKKAANMVPAHFYPNYLLVKLYDDSGQERKAVIMARRIMDKKIKIPSTAIKEIRAVMREILAKHKKTSGF